MEETIRQRIEALKERASNRETARYSKKFKEDATELVRDLRRSGWTQQRISKTLKLPWVTLHRWKNKNSPGKERTSEFRPVQVVVDEQTPVLVSPSGWRIEGLTISQLVELARRL